MSEIQKLYKEYKEFLASDTYVMRDDILFVLMRIEEQIQGILGTTEVSAKRENRYKLADQPNPQFHTKIAKEAQILHDNIGSGLSIQHMLGQIVRRQSQIKNLFSDASYEDICRDLGIVYQLHSDGKTRPFVPTDTGGKSPQIGSGKGWESETQQPKFLEFISILRTIQTPGGGFIDTQDIRVDCQTDTLDTMVRTLPYVVIRIPRLDRTILIDDRIGEATFVFQGILDLDIVRSESKTGLATYHSSKRIIYDKNWANTVSKYLITDWERESGKEVSEKNIPKSRINIDRASLFMDREFIRDSLERFAQKGNISIADLSVSVTPKRNPNILLSNGIEMTWNTFLNNSSQYLLGTSNTKENPPRAAEALDLLCERVGIVRNKQSFLDVSYFDAENIENLRSDLVTFAEKGNILLEALSTSSPSRDTKIFLSNGMEIAWNTFLLNASQYLLGTNQKGNNTHRPAEALNKLCEQVGILRNKQSFLDVSYFAAENIENIRTDFLSFAKEGNISLAELSSASPKWNTKIILSNGLEITWRTYSNNASQYLLGTTKRGENSHRRAEVLDLLCERVGIMRTTKRSK